MARNDPFSEGVDGLKMIEELTTNAHQIQDQVLEEILRRNAGTQYLKQFLNGQTDKQLFKRNVPIVTYEDVKPYLDRIANGEPSDILLADPIVEFFRSSSTSGGKPKLIPVTAETFSKQALGLVMLESVMRKHCGDLNQGEKRMDLMYVKEEAETPCGYKVRHVSTSYCKSSVFRDIVSKRNTSPIEAIMCLDTRQSMYCQLLAGLIQRDDVVSFASLFATTMLRAIKFLEHNWKELCSNIKTGQLSNWITDRGCRNAMSSINRANPDLAVSIEKICDCKSWKGIIKKLWPKVKIVVTITTGAMLQYNEALDFYCGGLPLASPHYTSSEALFGINLELLSKPAEVSYTFFPNAAYFEFLPVKKQYCITMSQDIALDGATRHESKEAQSNNEDIEPVDLVNVQLGQCYEVLVTTNAGLYRYRVGDIVKVIAFHNNAPQFQFIERSNVILSIDTDKTSESDLLKAITEAKTLLDPLGFILSNYTSYGDISSIPGHYVIFWELKDKDEDDIKELDPKVMTECCSRLEKSMNEGYKFRRKVNAIAPLEIRVVKQGTFDALMDYYISQGASMSQYKTPSCIKSEDALKILNSKVIEKFFGVSSTSTQF